jgi:hypothetical protein
MITGVKIARGGEGLNREFKTVGIGSELSADTMAAGPVNVCGKVSYSKGSHNS